jgi:AcrR family transcriptional regulator
MSVKPGPPTRQPRWGGNTERAAQAAGTRRDLLQHARKLFAQKGYAESSTDEVVRRAKVTKGALYHHFSNKLELYRAVVEDMERELVLQMSAAAEGPRQPQKKLEAACRAYLDACLDSTLTRILVVEAPVVLGWKEWCALAHQHEIAALSAYLESVVAKSTSGEPPLEMAHVLLGALNTAARVIAQSDDPQKARMQVEGTIDRLLKGLGY